MRFLNLGPWEEISEDSSGRTVGHFRVPPSLCFKVRLSAKCKFVYSYRDSLPENLGTPPPKNAKSPLLIDVSRSKTFLLKLPPFYSWSLVFTSNATFPRRSGLVHFTLKTTSSNWLRWLNTVLRAVSGNSRDSACFKSDIQTWRHKKEWYTEDDFSKFT